jgi:hypothetical protein
MRTLADQRERTATVSLGNEAANVMRVLKSKRGQIHWPLLGVLLSIVY